MKILYFLSTLLTISFISETYSLDCNNTLLAKMNITGRLKTPIRVNNLPYCFNLQSSTTARSCCNIEYLKNIQLFQDGVTVRLLELNGKKDQYIKSNMKYIKNLNTALRNLTSLMLKASNATLNNILRNRLAPFRTYFNALRSDFEDLINSFPAYQQQRAQCLRRMVMIQGGLYCLACDADYASRGVDKAGNITISNRLCTKIQVDCGPYLVMSLKQGRIAMMRRALTIIQGLANITADFNGFTRTFNMDANGEPISFLPETQRDGNPPVSYIGWRMAKDGAPVVQMDFAPADITELDIKVPTGCDDEQNVTKCTWLCTSAFSDNVTLSRQVFGVGGLVQYNDDTVMDAEVLRILQEEEAPTMFQVDDGTRILQGGGFDVDDGLTGTVDNVEADPAGVSGGMRMIVGWACMAISVVAFFVY